MGRPTISRVSASAPVADIVAALLDDGAVIVENFLSPAVMRRFNDELEPHLEEAERKTQGYVNDGIAAFFGPNLRHVLAVAQKSDTFIDEVLCHPIYIGVGELVLKKSCQNMQLNVAHVLDRGPGSTRQPLHRDEIVWPDIGPAHPHRQFSSVIALGEFTADIGATLVVPGSHKWDRSRKAKPEEVIAAEMEPGSAVIYLGGTLHAGGANITCDRRRRGMHVSYCLGWLRTEENNYLSVSMDRVRKLSPLAQTLLGYAAHDGISMGLGYLGAVDLRDPVELFAEGKL
jgi:ectoine hydroxylase-related dioxygenase (phytanoyl-CoA dioxygenase family)